MSLGIIGVLNAIMRRGTQGGSYKVDVSPPLTPNTPLQNSPSQVALNYYSQWLVNSVGVYPSSIFHDVWARNNNTVYRHQHNMTYTLPRMIQSVQASARDVLFKPEFFQVVKSGAIGKEVRMPKPVVRYPGGMVQLRYNVGTRGNGVDQPRWPEDLMTEVVV